MKEKIVLIGIVLYFFVSHCFISRAQELVKGDNGQAEKCLDAGKAFFKIGNLILSEYEFSKGLKLDPSNVELLLALGKTYAFQKKFDEAYVQYNKVLNINPQNVIALNGLADIYRLMNNYKEALETVNKAIEINPEYINSHLTLIEIYIGMGRKEDALQEYHSVEGKIPSSMKEKIGKIIQGIISED